jgi:hypothetical protein
LTKLNGFFRLDESENSKKEETMSALKTSRYLSCEKIESQSFLSCRPSSSNQNLSTQKPFRKESLEIAYSCDIPKLLESEANTPSSYRAKNELGQKAPQTIIGIDPGITGAIAFITSEGAKFVAVYDFPTKEILKAKGTKRRIDITDLALLIETYSKDVNFACIEEVGQIQTNADPFSSFVFGFATGLVHGVLVSQNIKIQTVKPLIWKGALGLDADKSKAIAKAVNLFPESAPFLKRKKDHGRAEALLLAYFAWKFGGGK